MTRLNRNVDELKNFIALQFTMFLHVRQFPYQFYVSLDSGQYFYAYYISITKYDHLAGNTDFNSYVKNNGSVKNWQF